MGKLEFRDLKAEEIDCRIATVKDSGMALLLYKDARCDMNILDETVGAFNWQRSHSRENANCVVSIWDEEKKQWISKEDTGTESNTEAAKGLASDSFKRACFNWGIGRELYTAPFIWIKKELYESKYDKFSVKDITIQDKKIVALTIYNDTTNKVVFTFGKGAKPKKAEAKTKPEEKPQEITSFRDEFRKFVVDNNMKNEEIAKILRNCKLAKDSPDAAWEEAVIEAKATVFFKGGSI